MKLTTAGLEPAIPGSVGRCLIHWATGPCTRRKKQKRAVLANLERARLEPNLHASPTHCATSNSVLRGPGQLGSRCANVKNPNAPSPPFKTLWPSGLRRQTQVLVEQSAWVRTPQVSMQGSPLICALGALAGAEQEGNLETEGRRRRRLVLRADEIKNAGVWRLVSWLFGLVA